MGFRLRIGASREHLLYTAADASVTFPVPARSGRNAAGLWHPRDERREAIRAGRKISSLSGRGDARALAAVFFRLPGGGYRGGGANLKGRAAPPERDAPAPRSRRICGFRANRGAPEGSKGRR